MYHLVGVECTLPFMLIKTELIENAWFPENSHSYILVHPVHLFKMCSSSDCLLDCTWIGNLNFMNMKSFCYFLFFMNFKRSGYHVCVRKHILGNYINS